MKDYNLMLKVDGQDDAMSTSDLKERILQKSIFPYSILDFYMTVDGRIVNNNEEVQPGKIYRLHPRILGGKGGFGSMLRALGAQIEKTTNREACRDLSGRRLRDVNNEKKLKEWITKAPEREKEKQEKKKQKKITETDPAVTVTSSSNYSQELKIIQENVEDAVEYAMRLPQKRKAEPVKAKPMKSKNLFGIDLDGSDSDDSSIIQDTKKTKLEADNKTKEDELEEAKQKFEKDSVVVENKAIEGSSEDASCCI